MAVSEVLLAWARDALKNIQDSGGKMPKRRLAEKGYSNKQLKQMILGAL